MGASLGAGRRDHRRFRRRSFTDINVTPFVDVMLVLLVIFMITAPMLTAGVSVDLPDSAASQVPGEDEPLEITVKSDKTIYLGETKIGLEDLTAKLSAIAGEKKDTRIFIRGDRKIDYGFVMQVVGEISAAGYSKVALVTVERGRTAKR